MYKLPGILRPSPKDTLWRYFSFEKFASLLSTKSLYFSTADQFEDTFEGYVPPPIMKLYKQHTQRLGEEGSQAVIKLWEEWRKWVRCSCWYHGDHESMAMWERERYSKHDSGIAIKTTMQSLEDSFTHEEGVDVCMGKVKYIDYQDLDIPSDILNMNTIYSPFFYKRKAFESEKEVRAIIDASPYIKRRFYRVKEGFSLEPEEFDLKTLQRRMKYPRTNEVENLRVDLKKLIDEVIIAPRAQDWVIEAIESMVHQYGFDFEVNPSTLLDKPSEMRKR